MNAKDCRDLQELINVVADIQESVVVDLRDIKICLLGDPKDRNDMGLAGDVRNNKKWKDNVQKTLTALGITTLTLFVKAIWEILKGR